MAVLFKDFSVLVIEQGTILDRIDYNVENAKVHIEEANVHLDKALKVEKSTRARKCLFCLATMIFAVIIMLIMKWSWSFNLRIRILKVVLMLKENSIFSVELRLSGCVT